MQAMSMTIPVYKQLLTAWCLLSVIIFFLLLKITAPYGRHARKGWGFSINNRLGWFLMEIVSPLSFGCFFMQNSEKSSVNWLFFSLWMAHYFNRSIIYPLRIPDKSKQMPLLISVSAICFNGMNGFLNGYYLGILKPGYENAWMTDVRFVLGILLFVSGFIINFSSDNILIHLRKNSAEGEYKIPEGGFFRWISCPNYLGEIIEWSGWAVATWSLPGFSFALWTAANLFPRAIKHHKWYRLKFNHYPSGRKAIIPGVI
ncbi:MAG TPA: DUF1295 domain-containing protein [Chitinophagales bacterium]|nr:DUF1295 domain-containing protein [Chitinophagales bacterium]